MCLVVLGLQTAPGLPLLILANHDEFHASPTAAAAWPDSPNLYAGRDLRAGGTWMGVTQQGRFAIITNFKEPLNQRPDAPSRGALVETYLRSSLSPSAYLEQVHAMGDSYNGFNLIVGDGVSSWYYSNRSGSAQALVPGIYGVSNHLLDTPWPKLARTKAAFTRVLQDAAQPDVETLYDILADKPSCQRR
jgi:uncharacterized protein with NRDE domain